MHTNSTCPHRKLAFLSGLILLGILSGCSGSTEQTTRVKNLESKVAALEAALAKSPPPAGAPRLGNIMGMVQLRHGKLWFAGEQENWPLAAYELHELEEDFEDVEKFHPTHGSAKLPLGQMAAELPKPAFTVLKQAIKSGDSGQFAAGFDALTGSCNICHSTAGLTFNVIQRPASSAFSNQDFSRHPSVTTSAALRDASAEAVGKRATPK